MSKRNIYNRVKNLAYTNGKRFFSPYFWDNNRRWKELKGKYLGKRIFLIANGPSLNITPLYLLKNEYTIVFNRILLMLERLNYQPNFYMLMDAAVAPTIKDDINYFIEHSELSFFPDIKKSADVDFTTFVPYGNKVLYMYEQPIRFSRSLPNIGCGTTVIYRAFQILMYLGFSEVIVVGNDMNYVIHQSTDTIRIDSVKGHAIERIISKKDDDPNHFDPRYFGKGKKYTQPTKDLVERIFKDLDVVAEEYRKSGISVINAGYDSMVKSFPKQEFYECLGYSQEKIDWLFDDLVRSKGVGSLKSMLRAAVEVDSIWEEDLDIAAVPIRIVKEIIPKKVIEYLPLGPYNGNVYMVNRKLLKGNTK